MWQSAEVRFAFMFYMLAAFNGGCVFNLTPASNPT